PCWWDGARRDCVGGASRRRPIVPGRRGRLRQDEGQVIPGGAAGIRLQVGRSEELTRDANRACAAPQRHVALGGKLDLVALRQGGRGVARVLGWRDRVEM